MLKVYGSDMCPDCRACKEEFDKYGVEYEFVDINESIANLKKFLIYRDSSPVFDHLKAVHDIGIPACVNDDGTVFTDWEDYLKEKGYEAKRGMSCSLNGKGC